MPLKPTDDPDTTIFELFGPSDILCATNYTTKANYNLNVVWEDQKEYRIKQLEDRIKELEIDVADLTLLKEELE